MSRDSQFGFPKIDWGVELEKIKQAPESSVLFPIIRRFITPSDAATARTQESEADKMVPLVIPSSYEVNRLIETAKTLELRAKAGGLALSPEERHEMLHEATGARVKALTLHLGIEI